MKSFQVVSKKHGAFEVLIDDEDFDNVMQYKWFIVKSRRTFYAVRKIYDSDGKRKNQFLHRFLLQQNDSRIKVDHKDNNGLNNRRDNIRLATVLQNNQNCRRRLDNTSGFRGVSRNKSGKFVAIISINTKLVYLGSYNTAEEASAAYEAKAMEIHGEFYNKSPQNLRITAE